MIWTEKWVGVVRCFATSKLGGEFVKVVAPFRGTREVLVICNYSSRRWACAFNRP